MDQLRKAPLSLILFLAFAITFVLFSFFPIRLDFSKGGAYTLSPSTRKTMGNINKLVEITLYVSTDLPTKVIPLKTDVVELLQEYRRSGKNVKVSVIDPKKDVKIADKAKQLGVPELQFSQLEKNKYQTSSFTFGIVIAYEGKTEVIPQVSDYQNLEYNLTSAIYRLTRTEMAKVAIIGENPGGYGQQDPLTSLKKVLSQQYTVVDLDMSTIKEEEAKSFIKDYATVVLLDNGTNRYSSTDIQLLKKYYESGKNLIVFADGIKIDERALTVSEAEHNLNELTATYGAHINYDAVLSTSAEYVNFGNEMTQFLAAYPFWIRSNLFNTKSGLFANIQFITFPWASSLTLKQNGKALITPLIVSSNKSWLQRNSFTLNPNSIPQPTLKDLKEYTLGALLKNTKGGEMIVISSSRFPLEQYMSRGGGNLDFILNAIDTFSSNGALSGIRSRIVSFYPLPDLSDTQKDAYKYTAILLFPLLWGLYGAVRLMRRK